MSTRTHITLPEDLYKRLEAARGDIPRSRFIVRAVEALVESAESPTVGNFMQPKVTITKGPPPVSQTWAR